MKMRRMIPLLLVLTTAVAMHGLGHWRLRREVAGRRELEQHGRAIDHQGPSSSLFIRSAGLCGHRRHSAV